MKKLILPVALVYICMNMYATNTEFSTVFEAQKSQLKKVKEEVLKLTEDLELPADLRKSLQSVDMDSFKIEAINKPDSDGNIKVNMFWSLSFPAAIFLKLFFAVANSNPASEPLNSSSF